MWWVELLNSFVSVLDSGGAGAGVGAFESIATVTASGGETSISLTSIPSTYVSLQIRSLVRTLRALSGTDTVQVRFNSDSGTNYVDHRITGNGSTVGVGANGPGAAQMNIINTGSVMDSSTAGIFAGNIIDIHNYASTTQNKVFRSFSGANGNTADTSFLMGLHSGMWVNTAAITSITFINSFGFKAGSVFSLYGIKGA